jgi:hypothetical protein
MSIRPIREITDFQVLWPEGKGAVFAERRQGGRCRCRLPASLVRNGIAYPVECREIGAGGVRVSSQWPIPLAAGHQVVMKVQVGTQNFSDSFTVLNTSPRDREGLLGVVLVSRAETELSKVG